MMIDKSISLQYAIFEYYEARYGNVKYINIGHNDGLIFNIDPVDFWFTRIGKDFLRYKVTRRDDPT